MGIVSPGVPMEIALNKESKRKTPSVVAFRDGMRTFGEDAQTLGLRFPATSYGYLIDLLGKTVDNPIVELYKYVAHSTFTHHHPPPPHHLLLPFSLSISPSQATLPVLPHRGGAPAQHGSLCGRRDALLH